MPSSDHTSEGKVIETADWLRERIDALVASGDYVGALSYTERLAAGAGEADVRLYAERHMGFLCLMLDQPDRAREHLLRADAIAPHDPFVNYALGHCAASRGQGWRAVLYFLEATHFATRARDRAEFMRSAAVALQGVGHGELAHAVLLGALDRDLGNPWILDALAHLYEQEERWLESLDTLDALQKIVASAASAMVVHTAPSVGQLLRNTLLGDPVGEQALRERAAAINRRLRNHIALVFDSRDREDLEPTGLARLNLPNALHILVRELDRHPRSQPLLESAQSLWARAHHERFDVFLTANTLAAAIHWLVERLHWRVPTSLQTLANLYTVDPETVTASARIVAERFETRFLPSHAARSGLNALESERLERIQRALLYDVDIRTLQAPQAMLF